MSTNQSKCGPDGGFHGIAKNTRSRRDMKNDFLDEDDEIPLMLPDKTVDPMKDIKRKVEEEMK